MEGASLPSTRGQRPARRFGPADLRSLLGTAPGAPRRPLRIRLAADLAALADLGGGETQLQSLHAGLNQVGLAAEYWRPWEDPLTDADCLHLVGSAPEHLRSIELARRRGLRVVLSPVAWFDVASRWHDCGPWWRRLRACGAIAARRAAPRLGGWRQRLYDAVNLLLPNSNAEAAQLTRLFGVRAAKIRVIPNGADERFAVAVPEPFAKRVGGGGFALYAGRIEPRKNQLGFLRAMRGSGVPIVILGDAVRGYEKYLAACRRAADANVTFVDRLVHDDPLLASAYAACGCLVLASWYETPGLVALEAAMSGTPLVLTARGSAREYFGTLATYVEPNDHRAIRRAVAAAVECPNMVRLARLVRERFTWHAAAQATREAYETLF